MVANATGLPAISPPVYWTAEGLPMSMMFTAAIGDEVNLLQLAAPLEQALPWRGRVAPRTTL